MKSEVKNTNKKLNENLILNRTFYRVTKTDSIDILYHYCNASINTIKVFKDSIWEDFGQEDYTMLVNKINSNEEQISFLGKPNQVTPEKLYTFKLNNKANGYWYINNKVFIDSLSIDKIKQYKEPDSECF